MNTTELKRQSLDDIWEIVVNMGQLCVEARLPCTRTNKTHFDTKDNPCADVTTIGDIWDFIPYDEKIFLFGVYMITQEL